MPETDSTPIHTLEVSTTAAGTHGQGEYVPSCWLIVNLFDFNIQFAQNIRKQRKPSKAQTIEGKELKKQPELNRSHKQPVLAAIFSL